MRNRSVLYFTGFMLAIVGFLIFDYSLRSQYLIRQSQSRFVSALPTGPVDTQAQPELSDLQIRARFLNRFKNFSTRMHALADEPEQSEALLGDFSQSVQPADLVALNEVLIDPKAKNDERTLALELMIAHQDFNGHAMLNSFIQNEQFGSFPNTDFEIALRAQAIEGLTLYKDKKLVRKNLENLKVRTRHAFLYDRANRALTYLSDENLATQLDSADAKASTR